ncbi:LysR family transcriptional regulator [Pseudorhodoplanes sp.]|jgi:molybdate transport repressor ModE-like protein|uniref:LysR family transcriptional regulator n=1 Tax=Pseudorhodoplanes sp. TaxID=1934341 RepID=UPI002C7E39CF|nr:LysR family transcriptional regulator [Pseudorhodoplanes sp.]HWV39991.1 LysR family transcriptional regulator [Pseudorhodoplanes sp.]
MLDAKRLRIFCAVAAEGSFTAAANRLHLTQSAVSQQIAILEREVGIPLVERLPRGVGLTEVGKVLAERGQSLLREIAALEQELHRVADPPTRVTLGVFSTAGAHLVPIVVQKYRERFPDTQLILHASQPEDLEAKLAEGLIDVGLTWDYDFLARPMGALHRRHLLNDPLCLLLPRSHPLASGLEPLRLAEVAHEPWIVRGHRPPYRDAFEVMCRIAGFEPDVVFHTEDYQSAQGLVAAGVGLAVVPRLSMTAQRPDIVLRPIHEPAFARRIEAVVLPHTGRNQRAEQLLSLLQETLSAGPHE